jgi:hypothetical protein
MRRPVLVLWGWKPGTCDKPIKLSDAALYERRKWDREGWFTDVQPPGVAPAAFRAWVAAMTSGTAPWGEAGTLRRDDDGRPVVEIATDLDCGRSWNDALSTSRTPPPSARCPYEYEHDTGAYPATFNRWQLTDELSERQPPGCYRCRACGDLLRNANSHREWESAETGSPRCPAAGGPEDNTEPHTPELCEG